MLEATVTENDTATRYGDVFPPAASTPFVLGLAEIACHNAVVALLADGEITVGTQATIAHLEPTPVGAILLVSATLLHRDGRRLEFHVDVLDGERVVARIEHQRVIVDRGRFIERLTA